MKDKILQRLFERNQIKMCKRIFLKKIIALFTAPIEEEEDSMQDYANVIRDTGPVPESNATSANVSDDETSSAISSKFKVSTTSSKVTSREVSPTRSIDSSKLSFYEEKSSEIKGEPMEVDEPKAVPLMKIEKKEKHDLSWLSASSKEDTKKCDKVDKAKVESTEEKSKVGSVESKPMKDEKEEKSKVEFKEEKIRHVESKDEQATKEKEEKTKDEALKDEKKKVELTGKSSEVDSKKEITKIEFKEVKSNVGSKIDNDEKDQVDVRTKYKEESMEKDHLINSKEAVTPSDEKAEKVNEKSLPGKTSLTEFPKNTTKSSPTVNSKEEKTEFETNDEKYKGGSKDEKKKPESEFKEDKSQVEAKDNKANVESKEEKSKVESKEQKIKFEAKGDKPKVESNDEKVSKASEDKAKNEAEAKQGPKDDLKIPNPNQPSKENAESANLMKSPIKDQDQSEVKKDSSKIKSPNKPSFGVADLIAPSVPKSSDFKPKEVSKFSIASICQSDSKSSAVPADNDNKKINPPPLPDTENESKEIKNGDSAKKRPIETEDSDVNKKAKVAKTTDESSPIIGETIKESVKHVEGQGNGADNNSSNFWVSEAISEEIILTFGRGSGKECDAKNDHATAATNANGQNSNGLKHKSSEETTTDQKKNSQANKNGSEMSGDDEDDEDMEDEEFEDDEMGDEEMDSEDMEDMEDMEDEEMEDEEDEDEDDDLPEKKSGTIVPQARASGLMQSTSTTRGRPSSFRGGASNVGSRPMAMKKDDEDEDEDDEDEDDDDDDDEDDDDGNADCHDDDDDGHGDIGSDDDYGDYYEYDDLPGFLRLHGLRLAPFLLLTGY